jgi:hypothetical protein
MAVVRRNVLTSPHAQTFLDGVVTLSGPGQKFGPV